MSDANREAAELRREIVEARNQAIKTDNQVKNLSLDVKGFEKRFDSLEKRVRLSSVGVNLIVATTVGLAAYAVGAVRIRAYEHDIAALQEQTRDERESAQAKSDAAQERLSSVEKMRRAREVGEEVALQ